MKRLFVVLGFIFILTGCEHVPVSSVGTTEMMQQRFITTSQLHMGLSRAEVVALLGKEVVIGYSLVDEKSEQYKPLTMANPQRSEIVRKNNKTYSVDYYLIGIKVADDKISDEELIPLIFQNDRLIGLGWDFLSKNVKG